MSKELHAITIAEAARLIAARDLSPVEYTEALLARIESLDPKLDAVITVTAEHALVQARAAEKEIAAGRHRGPMHGIPFGLKDIYETEGIRTTAHSRVLIDHVPARDAETVRRLYEAGAVLLGKLATHEFAHGGPSLDLPFPPARNPWNLECQPGGSSSGSGAAVAAGFMPTALGSDTGGSIRGPAGLCGLVGVVPSFGLVSRRGVLPNSNSFDHCGPFAWTVEDAAIVLQVLAGHDPADPSSVSVPIPDYRAGLKDDLKGLRIGVLRHFYEDDEKANAEQATAMEASLKVLSDLGATVEEVRLRSFRDYYDVKVVIAETELVSTHYNTIANHLDKFGWDMRSRILGGALFTSVDYVNAQRLRRRMQVEADALFRKVDLLVTLGPGPAGPIANHRPKSFWDDAKNPTTFNVVGGPVVTLCNGFTATGMPMSMQIVGRPFEEATVLRAAHAYERATPWRDRRPSLSPDTPKPEIVAKHNPPVGVDLDPETRRIVEAMLARNCIKLSDQHFAELADVAPHVLAMANRIARGFDYSEEGSNVAAYLGTELRWPG